MEKHYAFELKRPFLVSESELQALLTRLRESEFRDTIAATIRFHTEETYKNKWHVTFYATSTEVLDALSLRIARIMSEVWYGEDLTHSIVK